MPRGFRGGFSFADADEIFRNFFGGRDPFEEFGFGRMDMGMPGSRVKKQGGRRDPFADFFEDEDDFFGGGFGGGFGGFGGSSMFS